MAWRRFAAAGLVPGSLVGWELFAYGKQRQKFDDAKKVRPKPLVEGSTAWLIERDARTLDLVCVRHKALDRGPAAAEQGRGRRGRGRATLAAAPRAEIATAAARPPAAARSR